MKRDDDVCLCFHVSQRKVCAFLKREQPKVASQLSECLGAGTGCGWCVPFLEQLHRQWAAGELPQLKVPAEGYASGRSTYRSAKASDQTPDTDDNSSV
jgi:NAD(P)H-nitrite reductase large subunit